MMEVDKSHYKNDEVSLKEMILNLKDWIEYLFLKWKIICVVVVLGSVLGVTYSMFQKPTYKATTSFVMETDNSGGLSSFAGLASMAGLDLGGNAGGLFTGDNLIELYKSRKMIEKVLLSPVSYDSTQLLVDLYINLNELRVNWEDNPQLLNIKFGNEGANKLSYKSSRLQDSLLGKFVDKINLDYLNVARSDLRPTVIQVSVSSKDEVFAYEFNKKLVQTVNEFYKQAKTQKSTSNISILQAKVDSVRAVMDGAIYNAASVIDATPNANPTRQAQRVVPMQKSQFNAESNRLILAELVKNLELAKITMMRETPLIQIIADPVYPLNISMFGIKKGVIFGGFLAGFLTVAFLVVRRIYKKALED